MDNYTTNPGTGGSTFASDDIAGINYPRVKVSWGVDGAAVDASATDPLPVGGTALTNLGATIQTHDLAAGASPQGQLILAVRQDADTSPVSATGDFTYLTTNEVGRLKTAGAPAQFTPVTGAITGVSQSISAEVSQASNVMFYVTGTFAGVNCTFEGSIDGGTSWFGIQAVRSNANTIETTTGVLGAAPAYAWEASVNALTNFRVRSTAWTSGTANWRITLGSYATEPIPAAQISGTQPVSGTVTANIGTGSLAAGTNAIGDVGIQGRANATGAASVAKIAAAATTNATLVKNTAGRVFGWSLTNTTAAVKVVRLYNLTIAPVVGTSAPIYNIVLPANAVTTASFPVGIGHATGISYAITNAIPDLDATAVAANDVIGEILWL